MAPLKLSFRVSGMTRDVPSPAKQRGGGGLAASSLAWSHPVLGRQQVGLVRRAPVAFPPPRVLSSLLLCFVTCVRTDGSLQSENAERFVSIGRQNQSLCAGW